MRRDVLRNTLRLCQDSSSLPGGGTLNKTPAAPARVVDTLALGFNLALSCLAALTVAVGLDLLYWLGPRIILGQAWLSLVYAQLQALPATFDATAIDTLMQSAQVAASVNLLQTLSGALGLGGAWPLAIPSLMASDPNLPTLGVVWEAPSLGWALLMLPALLIVGCLFGSIYLTLIAARVRGERPALDSLMRWILGTWGRVLTLNLLLLLIIFVASLPLTIALIVANLIHPTLGAVAIALATVVIVLLWAHGLFTLPALVLDRVNPIRAYWRSLVLVRYNFWSAVGLMGLAFVLSVGLGEVWRWLGEMPMGAPIGMVGNAFVGTALTAAILIFYRERRQASTG